MNAELQSIESKSKIIEDMTRQILRVKTERDVLLMLDALETGAELLRWACGDSGRTRATQSTIVVGGSRYIWIRCTTTNGTRYVIDNGKPVNRKIAISKLFNMLDIEAS